MNDKPSMAAPFDEIAVRRADLARGYCGMLRGQPGRPLALFALRRGGYALDDELLAQYLRT